MSDSRDFMRHYLDAGIKLHEYVEKYNQLKSEHEKEKFENLSLIANLDAKIGELEQKLEIVLNLLERVEVSSAVRERIGLYKEIDDFLNNKAIKEIKGW